MLSKDTIAFKDTVNIKHISGKTGEILSEQTVKNLIVDEGRQFLLDQVLGSGVNKPMKYIGLSAAIVSGEVVDNATTIASEWDTTPGSNGKGANGLTRYAGTYSLAGNHDSATLAHTFDTGDGAEGVGSSDADILIKGAGLFDQTSLSGDKMFACAVFDTPVTLDGTAGDTLTVTWTIALSQA
jgi:hypothetical protein